MDPSFSSWYGDQEALKSVYKSGKYNCLMAHESQFACLPEFVDPPNMPTVIHFKGPKRKLMMKGLYDELFGQGQ
jgi:hypothetical protein